MEASLANERPEAAEAVAPGGASLLPPSAGIFTWPPWGAQVGNLCVCLHDCVHEHSPLRAGPRTMTLQLCSAQMCS